MENSLYIGLSKQVVLEENMAIIANNVANVSTPGFRGQNMVFLEYIEKPRGMKEDVAMVLDYGQYQITDPGPVSQTGNPLDLALVGPGFFGVQTPEGIQYTRAGNLSLNPLGQVVNARGQPVVDQGGGILSVPADANAIYVDEKGVISTDDGEVGQLMITEFPSEQILEPAGNGLYRSDNAGTPATETRVKQGYLEGSNVQPVIEMTRMIEVSREYQSMQRLMQSEHERLRTAIQRLSRTNG